eukprot:gene22489-29615_t
MSVEARQLARRSATMDISDWRKCSQFTRSSNTQSAVDGLTFDYHCIKGYANVFELGKFWAPDAEDFKSLADTASDLNASPLVRAQALSTRGYLLVAEGVTEAAIADYLNALSIAQRASAEERKQLEWIMTTGTGVSSGQLLDNIISEVARRLEGLTLKPLHESTKDIGSDKEQMELARKLASAGNWRTSTDLYQGVYEDMMEDGSAWENGNAAFTSYVDSFRLAVAVPSQDDMDFLERVASDSSSPPLVRAQAWTLRGLMAWSWDRPDTALWQLDEAVMWARSSTKEERARKVEFVDLTYGGFRNVSLDRMLDAAVEDASAVREILSSEGQSAPFPGLSTHVFTPQDRAFTNQYASTSELQTPPLVAPMSHSLARYARRIYKRWEQARDQVSKPNPNTSNKTAQQRAAKSKRQAPTGASSGGKKNGTAKSRLGSDSDARVAASQADHLTAMPVMAVKVKEAPLAFELSLSQAQAGTAGFDMDDDGTDVRCKAVMEAACPLCPFCRVPVDACVQIFS